MLPRFILPKKIETIIENGKSTNQFFRFMDQLSRGAWKKSYPNVSGSAVNYTVTSTPALVSLILASITPYKRDDQTPLIDINITLTVASAARTTITMALGGGIKFKNTTGLYQPVTGYAMDGTAPYPIRCYAELNTGNIIFTHASATTTIYSFRATGLILEESTDFAE